MLPKLSDAISSNDPSVRANAIAACGAVDAPEALDCLAKGWAFEDRKTREALTKAFAASRQPQATAMLVKLFIQCCRDTEALRKELDKNPRILEIINPARGPEGKAAELARQRMATVLPEDFTYLLYRAWTEKRQEFFRLLAAENELPARMFAARELGDAKKEDIAKGIPVLHALLNDPDRNVSCEAAVSLVLFGDEDGKKALLKALQTTGETDLDCVARTLWRVRDPGMLAFARQQLETIAANTKLKEATRRSVLRVLNDKR